MRVRTVEIAQKPDVQITLTNGEAEYLYTMLNEAKSYADVCGESTIQHQEFIDAVSQVLDEE